MKIVMQFTWSIESTLWDENRCIVLSLDCVDGAKLSGQEQVFLVTSSRARKRHHMNNLSGRIHSREHRATMLWASVCKRRRRRRSTQLLQEQRDSENLHAKREWEESKWVHAHEWVCCQGARRGGIGSILSRKEERSGKERSNSNWILQECLCLCVNLHPQVEWFTCIMYIYISICI